MSVTIQELEEKAEAISKARAEKDAQKIIYQRFCEEADKLEYEYLALMESAEIASYKSKVGTFTIANRTSVKFPQDMEQRRAFAEWAKEKGIYEELFTVSSPTLNSLYKREKEFAEEKGELFFQLPGIAAPTLTPILSLRK